MKKMTLKNGTQAIFRRAEVGDAAKLLEFLKAASAQTDYLLRYPEEWMSVKDEKKFLRGLQKSRSMIMLCCEIDGKIVGNCCLSFNSVFKTRHRASVAVAVLEEYWGLGIATEFFEEMAALAAKRGVTQLELDFIEGNERARRLYEKLGFAVVAQKPDAVRLKDGTMLKEYFMIKKLC